MGKGDIGEEGEACTVGIRIAGFEGGESEGEGSEQAGCREKGSCQHVYGWVEKYFCVWV
jgi:hypothetical protein